MQQLLFLAVGMFAIGCNSFVVAGLLPGMGETLGASVAATGQGITAYGLAYVVCAPTFAILLGKRSPRRVLLVALATFVAGNGLTLLATTLPLHLASRAITGAGAGLFTPACVSAAIGLFGASARGRILSLILGASSAGAVLGVPAALWLAGRYGWQAAIAMTVGLGLVCLLGLAMQRTQWVVATPPSIPQQLRLLTDRRVLSVIGITCLTTTGSLGLYSFAAPVLSGTPNALGPALFLWSLGGLLGSTAVGFFVDRTGAPKKVMMTLLGVLLSATLLLPQLRAFPVLGLLPFFFWGAAGWATVMPQQHILIDLEPAQGRSLVALNSSVMNLGAVLGTSVGGGLLAAGLDAGYLPYVAAFALLGALLWQWTLLHRVRTPSLHLSKVWTP